MVDVAGLEALQRWDVISAVTEFMVVCLGLKPM
jgi:hypothetical protein